MYVWRVFSETELDVCRRVPERDSMVFRVYDELPMLRQGNARGDAGIGSWAFRDCSPVSCIDLLDFIVGYDK